MNRFHLNISGTDPVPFADFFLTVERKKSRQKEKAASPTIMKRSRSYHLEQPRHSKRYKSTPRCDEDEDDDEEKDAGCVTLEDNHIYFYSDVTQKSIFELNRYLRKLDVELQTQAIRFGTTPKIFLHIHSDGGEVFSGLAAVDTIEKCKTPVVSIVEGCAASAATLISVVADERQMTPHSHMLIHQLSSGFWGKMAAIEEEVENLQTITRICKKIYEKHTKLKGKKLDTVLKKDKWWTYETCLRNGLVDRTN